MEAKQISPEKPAKCFVRRTHARDPGSTPPLPPASGCQVPDYARARAAEGAWVQTPERLLARGSWQPAYYTGGCAVSPGAMLSLQSCLTLCDLMDHSPTDSSVHGQNTGVGCHLLLQGIFPTQGSKLNLSHVLDWQAGSLPLVPPGKRFLRFSSVAQSCPTLRPQGLQHTRPPCPSPAPGACSNLCPSSR